MTSVINTFTYDGWEADKATIEKTLARSSSSFVEQHAKQKLKAMQNKQHLHDGNDGLHPGIAQIQVPGAYTYEGIADDLKETFKQYMLGNDKLTDRLVEIIDFKQKIHDEDRSDKFLVELDSYTFCYPGWKDDKAHIEDALASSLRGCAQYDARRQLKGMERKQQIYEEEGYPAGITLLHSGVFSYPTFCKDKVAALEYYESGDDVAHEQMLKRIQSKQIIHDGAHSHPLLSALNLAEFTYPQWEEDRITVEDTLMHSVNSFAEFDAKRLHRGMQNKQSFFSGIDLHPGISILRSDIFSYKGFKRDKRDAMNEYRAGYTCAFEKRLGRIQEKQKLHDGDRSNSVLTTLDAAAKCTPSPKKKVTFYEDEQTPEKEETRVIHTKDVERWVPDDCVICLSAPRTHIFAPCGHLSLCNSCAFKTPYRKRKRMKKVSCPICRQVADSIVKIYF